MNSFQSCSPIANAMGLNHSSLQGAILDLDGTLVDTLGDFVAALNAMLGDLPLPPDVPRQVTRETAERFIGKGSEFLVESVLKQALALSQYGSTAMNSEATLARAVFLYQTHYRVVNGQHATVYPGVKQGLEALRARGVPLACVTNKPTAFADELLAMKGLGGYFQVVFGGDAFARKKPDPLPFLKACEALHTLPAHTLVIGDSSNDAQAARAAGCPVLLVTYGYNHGEPVQAVDADGFIDSLASLAST